MSYSKEYVSTPQTDQRFIAETVTETGVTLRGESEWVPYHWEQEKYRREAESDLRRKFKPADLMKVKVGPIRIYRETRITETVAHSWTNRNLYAEVAR